MVSISVLLLSHVNQLNPSDIHATTVRYLCSVTSGTLGKISIRSIRKIKFLQNGVTFRNKLVTVSGKIYLRLFVKISFRSMQ